MTSEVQRYETFLGYATVALGAIMGLLIASPLATIYAQSENFSMAYLTFAVFTLGGALVGYRRRKSRAFLYFCMIGTAVLSSIISFSMSQ